MVTESINKKHCWITVLCAIRVTNKNNRINPLRQICTIIRAISLPNKEHMENYRITKTAM